MNFSTVHALHFARQGWTEGSKQVCRAGLWPVIDSLHASKRAFLIRVHQPTDQGGISSEISRKGGVIITREKVEIIDKRKMDKKDCFGKFTEWTMKERSVSW